MKTRIGQDILIRMILNNSWLVNMFAGEKNLGTFEFEKMK